MTEDTKALELKNNANTVLQTAQALAITDQASLNEATSFVIRVRQLAKAIDAYWADPVAAAHKAWKLLTDRRKAMKDMVDEADKIASKKVVAYKNEQDRIAAEEKRKAEEKRLAEEQAAKAKLEKRAMNALEKGNEEKAELLMDQADQLHIAPTFVGDEPKKTETVDEGSASMIDEWEVQIKDVGALCAAIVSFKFPPSFVKVIESEIKTWAKQRNITTYDADGIVITKTKRIATRPNFNKG